MSDSRYRSSSSRHLVPRSDAYTDAALVHKVSQIFCRLFILALRDDTDVPKVHIDHKRALITDMGNTVVNLWAYTTEKGREIEFDLKSTEFLVFLQHLAEAGIGSPKEYEDVMFEFCMRTPMRRRMIRRLMMP